MIRPNKNLWAALLATTLVALALPATAQTPPGTWQKIAKPAPVIGADGKLHRAACSGFPGTDASFSFWAKRGTSKNIAVYFEGGGACWDSLTCSFPFAPGLPATTPQFYSPDIPANTDPATFDGIFQAANPANPVKDWSIVYIPYCTGDLHAGSTRKRYARIGAPNPALPSTFTIQHRGFDNFMVVLDWMKKNLDTQPSKLLVTGVSAGGYGATVNFPWLQRTYPQAQSFVIADASQGVTTEAWDTGTPGRGSWNIQLAPWVFGDHPESLRGAELLRVASLALPEVKTAQFTTALDAVQIGFYGVMKLRYGPGGSCADPATDWYQQMAATLQSYAATVPNYRYFVAAGDYHTIMSSPQFYTEASTGTVFSDWVGAMLGQSASWQDAACETCLIPVACP